jgi:triosephosphate isomerase
MAVTDRPQGRTPLIAGNWKMNLDHLQAIAFVQKLAWSLKDAKHDYQEAEVAVFPPATDIRSVQTLVSADKLELAYGAQDVSEHESGAYTGEISAAFLAQLACRYVIVGHSETAADLEEHGASAVPVAQLRVALQGLAKGADVVVAYEPVWAIGSGQAATPEQAQQVAAPLRAVVAELLGDEAAKATRILYGGSVKSGNIAGFLREPDVDGALVGGASLDVQEFSAIARFRSHVGV